MACDARGRSEEGFTLTELLVTILLLSIASIAMYQMLFSVARSTGRAESQARISDEGRLGFNRMVRDTREGQELTAANPESFTVKVDYENDNLGPQFLTFEKDGDRILLNDEVLMEGVDCLRPENGGACQQDIFRYTSNRLEYDWNKDGITTWEELDESADASHGVVGVGNNDDVLNDELAFVTDVTIAIDVSAGDASGRLFAEAQLRNRR